MDEQPRLTDLIPIQLTVVAGLMLLGLAIVVGLEFLYTWMPDLAPLTSDGRVASIDLDGEGSLAVWFSSMTLAAAGLVAMIVYQIRQHRTDDYHGRYRIWLWAAACCFLMSLDETASLHESFKELMANITGTRLMGDGSMWWVTVYLFLLGVVGTRLLIDMRECLLSLGAILATAACYAVAIATQLGWILPESGARGVMLEEGAEMVGNLTLLLAMLLHARHVILDAQGLLPERKSKGLPVGWPEMEDEEIDMEAIEALERSVKVHPPRGRSRSAVAQRELDRADQEAEAAEMKVKRKLTKGERKALRKRLRQSAERQRHA